jgi:predicted glycoside hydrolase/deacetylase ChbG (UPF0249 family)
MANSSDGMSQLAAMQKEGGAAPIVICADDYGLSPGVGVGIRELIERGRLSATSCMTASPHWPAEAGLLRPLRDAADIGLHLTLTDQKPLGPMPKLAPEGRLPSLGRLLALALAGRLDPDEIAAEAERQFDRFEAEFGGPPDHLDGHHHVHLLPGVREAAIDLFRRRMPPGAWLRHCDESVAAVLRTGVAVPRALLIAALGAGLRRAGLPGNRGFRGVRSFHERASYETLFGRFVAGLRPGGLVMCHPAAVDEALRAADPVAEQREEERRFLASEGAVRVMAAAGVRPARLRPAFTPA